jgi:hypothetical protein
MRVSTLTFAGLLLCLAATTGCTRTYARVSDGTVTAESHHNDIVSRVEVSGRNAAITELPPPVTEVRGGPDNALVRIGDRTYRVHDRVKGTSYRIASVSRTDDTTVVMFTPAD